MRQNLHTFRIGPGLDTREVISSNNLEPVYFISVDRTVVYTSTFDSTSYTKTDYRVSENGIMTRVGNSASEIDQC